MFTEAPVTSGGSSYYRSTLRFKACVMTFDKLLNVHGRCLLKVSNAISAHFILSSYFLANSSLPPLSLFLLLLYFSSLSNFLFFFLLSMIAIPRSDIEDDSNAIQNVGPIIFMSVLMFMCIHHSEKKIRFLFGLCLAIVPFRQLKAFRLTTILCFLFLSQ